MDIVGVENDGLLERWLYGFDPKEQDTPEDDPRALAGSQMRSVMIYLKNDRIYVFAVGFVGYRLHRLDRCRAQYPANVTESVLGRDILVLMRASGRFMSKDEAASPETVAAGLLDLELSRSPSRRRPSARERRMAPSTSRRSKRPPQCNDAGHARG
jgi:hypothetical protein